MASNEVPIGRKSMLRFVLALIYGDNIRPW